MYKQAALLVAWLLVLLSTLPASAQTTTDTPYEQTRRRIWCETFQFIYQDNGNDSLAAALNCSSWEAMLAQAQEHDARYGAYRFYQAVDKPEIYAGITVDEQKLNKLAGEIQYKLMDRRKGNKRKEAAVDSLYKVLQRTALMMTGTAAAASSQVAESEPGLAQEAGAARGEPVLNQEENLADDPTDLAWNDILQWLFILLLGGGLYWLYHQLQRSRSRLHELRKKHDELHNAYFSTAPKQEPAVPAKPSGPTASEISAMVQQEVDKRLAQLKAESKGREAPPAKPAAAIKAEPSSPAPETIPPTATNATSGGTNKNSNPPTAASEAESPKPTPEKPAYLYDKMPVRGGFHQGALSKSPQRDSVYVLEPKAENSPEALYWINEEPEVQKYAMQNGLSFFEEGCLVEEVKENPSRVVNLKKGLLRKDGPSWQIVEKAKIKFE